MQFRYLYASPSSNTWDINVYEKFSLIFRHTIHSFKLQNGKNTCFFQLFQKINLFLRSISISVLFYLELAYLYYFI